MIAAWLVSLAWAVPGDDGPLGLVDLAAYRDAIARSIEPGAEVLPVTFRDLWDRPDSVRGKIVEISGRVERIFHQGPVGAFPALAEVWIADAARNPICVVVPEPADLQLGAVIQIRGTFLRRIRYRGGDVDRLAPLVVGPGPPVVEGLVPAPPAEKGGLDGMFVAVVAGIVVLGLMRAHLRRPRPRPIIEGPPPEFVDAGRHEGGN